MCWPPFVLLRWRNLPNAERIFISFNRVQVTAHPSTNPQIKCTKWALCICMNAFITMRVNRTCILPTLIRLLFILCLFIVLECCKHSEHVTPCSRWRSGRVFTLWNMCANQRLHIDSVFLFCLRRIMAIAWPEWSSHCASVWWHPALLDKCIICSRKFTVINFTSKLKADEIERRKSGSALDLEKLSSDFVYYVVLRA